MELVISILALFVVANMGATYYFARNLGKVEGRLDNVERRLDSVERRLDSVERILINLPEEIRRIVREELESREYKR